ncbi:MAG: PIN domain-containing protein [Candidatus Bathyarchaeota archaeon]|nr:PIN domain-containing protein [Candidatus Bathyarchaeota archaeon]
MKKPAKPYQILLDNNIYVAAIHDPVRETASLKLIIEIIQNKQIKLIGNKYLLEEMSRYSEVFPSPTALMLLRALIAKMEVIHVEERFIKLCLNYMDSSYPVDVVHAASCLQTDSILITNDRHFDRLKQEKIIKVWNTGEAIENLV